MIPRKNTSEHTLRWKKEFADSIFGHQALSTALPQLDIDSNELARIDNLFPIQIPSKLLTQNMDTVNNSLLRQYLPDSKELIDTNDSLEDPVGDLAATKLDGVIKKYAHRVLIVTSNICPVHCRYCFRKNYPYAKENPNTHRFQNALDYCRDDSSINEVILSGGDPLSLEDDLIEYLLSEISKISHVKTIRLHTKFPSIIPNRITPKFLAILEKLELNKVCVFHINHPDEISEEFCEAAQKIRNTNTVTLNQSVLLKGINNDAGMLAELSYKLFGAGILPYYLHELDHAKGTSHFKVSVEETAQIFQDLKNLLPGYLVPKLAREIAGQTSKMY